MNNKIILFGREYYNFLKTSYWYLDIENKELTGPVLPERKSEKDDTYKQCIGEYYYEKSILGKEISFAVYRLDNELYLYFDGEIYSFCESKIEFKTKKGFFFDCFSILKNEEVLIEYEYFRHWNREFHDPTILDEIYPLRVAQENLDKNEGYARKDEPGLKVKCISIKPYLIVSKRVPLSRAI